MGAPADARYGSFRPTPPRVARQSAFVAVDRMHFWRPLPRSAVDVICGEGVSADAPLHMHEALQVMLPASDFGVVDGAGRCTLVTPGVVHLTSPLELHAPQSIGGAPIAMRVMLVGPSVLAELAGKGCGLPFDGAPGAASRVVDDAALCAELRELFDVLRRPLVALERAATLRACVARLAAAHADRSAPAPASPAPSARSGVRSARDHVRAHVTESVSLDELAGVAGLSKFYLLRAFREAYGLTPHAYQMQLRLARARRLIADGRPLSHVTYDAGFADQSHLTRRFAAFYGLTPARYARQLATRADLAPRLARAGGRAARPRPAA